MCIALICRAGWRQSACFLQRFIQQHFDLPVYAAEFVGRPTFQRIVGL